MRWFERSVMIGVLMVLMTPAPAHAWFEWLDYLSGPGPFYGATINARVWCSGHREIANEIRAAQGFLAGSVTKLRGTAEPGSVQKDWKLLSDKMISVNQTFPVLDAARLLAFKRSVETVSPGDIRSYREWYVATLNPDKAVDPALPPLASGEVPSILFEAQTLLAQLHRAQVSSSAAGIFVSFCSPDIQRKFALEVGFSPLVAPGRPEFAGGSAIHLNTVTAAVTYRVFARADRDVLDVGFLAGRYRFSSNGFRAFEGTTVESFLDVHGPTAWINDCGVKQLAALLTLRLGRVWFPGGFDADAFAAARPRAIRGSEGITTFTVFFNITPLLRHHAPTLGADGT